MTSLRLASALSLAISTAAGAQPITASRPDPVIARTVVVAGDTVRAWARTPRLNGVPRRVLATTLDTLSLGISLRTSLRAVDSATALPFSALTRLEVQRGRRHSGAQVGVGALAGLLVGGLAGVIAGSVRSCSPCGEYEELENVLDGITIGAMLGAIGGGALGARASVPAWEPVPLPVRRTSP